MNPFDLIPWAAAIGTALVMLALPVFIITAAWSAGRNM